MTPDEISTMSRAVATHFGLWTPRQMCNYGDVRCRHLDEPLADTWDELTQGKFKPHEIPCPNLTQPEHFVRLLKAAERFLIAYNTIEAQWYASDLRDEVDSEFADTPEEALLLAAYQLVQRGAALREAQ